MSKHTPGPWQLVNHYERIGDSEGTWQIWGSQRICFTESQNVGTDQEEANARLIAASPDLLENLKDMVRRFEGCLITNGTDREFARSATVHARAAIAKAEGVK